MNTLLSIPVCWELVQGVLGANQFKRELYLSRLRPRCKLLDFGCATGHIADIFSEFDYYGIDIDPLAIAAAKRRFRDRPNMHFIAADLCTRPFPPEGFDEALFACTIHHLDDQRLQSILRELHYCIKSDGVIHVFDLVRQDNDGWSQKLMRRLDQGKYMRSLPQIVSLIDALGIFDCGGASLHTPYGAPLTACDVAYLPLKKKRVAQARSA
jgi:SAM-dependent methyltransferase